jgi:hypothetical protein
MATQQLYIILLDDTNQSKTELTSSIDVNFYARFKNLGRTISYFDCTAKITFNSRKYSRQALIVLLVVRGVRMFKLFLSLHDGSHKGHNESQ